MPRLALILLAVLLASCGGAASRPDAPVDDGFHPFNDPLNRAHPEVVGGWDIEHYRIEVAVDPKTSKVDGTTTIRAKRTGAGPLELDAVGLKVSSVTVNSVPSHWEADGLKLRVSPSMNDATVGITYTATPRHGLFRVADPPMLWSQGETEYNAHWFPCWAPPNDFATSEVVAHVPAGMTAISNGALVEQRDGFFHWRTDQPMASYLVSLVVGDFEKVEIGGHRVPVDVYVPRGRYDLGDVRRTFMRTPAMIEFLEKKTGVAYPWAKYSQVVVKDFFWGGMENTSATTLYEHAVVKAAHAHERDMDGLIVHELAHQWFGNLVTCRTWSELWLNEGFATYFEYLWDVERKGVDKAADLLQDWADAVVDSEYQRPLVTDHYTHPDDMFDSHSYEKGGWVLRMLHQEIGDEAFWKGVKAYLTRHTHRPVTSADLRGAMQEASGAALDGFFRQWVHRSGFADLTVKQSWDAVTKSLRVAITQRGEPIRATIEIDAGGKTVKAALDGELTDIYLALDERPAFVDVDPRGRLLKSLTWTKGHDELIAQIERGSALGRRWAAEQLEDDPDPAAAPALLKALDESTAKALAQCNAKTLVDAIPEMQDLTSGIVRALGDVAQRDDAGALLRRIAREHTSPLCRAAAWEALGHRADAFNDLASVAESLARDEWLLPGVLKGLAATKDERAVAILGKAAAADRPGRIRDTAVEMLGTFKTDAARRGLMSLLDDSRFLVRLAAVRGLAENGDAAAATLLELRLTMEVDGQLQQAIRKTLRRLRP